MPPRILVIGEALVDVVRRADGNVEEIPGGSPANVAITLGRLGRSPQLLTALGSDDHGRRLRAWLAESDVMTTHVGIARTPTAIAELDAEGSATYVFDIEWSLSDIAVEPASLIHVGSIGSLLEPGASDVLRILDENRDTALITYDPNIRPLLVTDRTDTRQRVEALVARADVVKASDEDLRWLYPRRHPHQTAHVWRASGPALVIVTEGADGVFAVAEAGEFCVPSRPVDIVDTVGAGDTFMGALIDGLLDACSPDSLARADLHTITESGLISILDWAARAAAVTVSRRGANPPRRDELA